MSTSRAPSVPGVIPADALEQHIGIVAKTGKGKTYAAKSVVESLLDAGRVVGIVDPTDAWWGLRLAADGVTPVHPKLVILGGRRGDMPLPPRSGAAVAELLCGQRVSLVACTKHMTVGERTRWFIDFATALLRINARPVHLVIDEVHNFAPQGKVPDPDVGRMLHAANALFSEGRSIGFRMIGISQRPAKWHKDSLTCVDTLVALGMVAPQDREAVHEWIDGCGDQARGKEVLASLAGLKRGTGWVWFPEGDWLKRVEFPRIATFDSSATPTHDAAAEPDRQLGQVDLTAVKAALAEAVAESEENDVKLLKAQVAELRAKLAKAAIPTAVVQPAAVDRQIEAAVERTRVDALQAAASIGKSMAADLQELAKALDVCQGLHGALMGQAGNLASSTLPRAMMAPAPVTPRPAPRLEGTTHVHEARDIRAQRVPDAGHRADLSKPQQRLVDAIAWWNAIGIPAPTRVQVAHVAGYTKSGGTWKTLQSECRTDGVIEYQGDGLVLTDLGHRCAAHPEVAGTSELHERVLANLTGPQAKLFRVLVDHAGGAEISRTQAAELAGYEASGGTWKTLVSELSTLGLCRYPKKTTVQAAAWLFPEAIR